MDWPTSTWITVAAPAAAVVGSALLYGTAWPRAQLFGPVLHHAPTPGSFGGTSGGASGGTSGGTSGGENSAPPRVALVFLGGPSPTLTPTLLDTLQRRELPAAFALSTEPARQHPRLLQTLDDAGHLLVNHGPAFRAAHLAQGYGFWRHHIDANDDALFAAIGQRPRLLCPPHGFKSPVMLREALWGGHAVVTWSKKSQPWLPRKLDTRRLAAATAGMILALPGTSPRTLDTLPALLESLRAQGLRPQRLDRLLGLPGYRTTTNHDEDAFTP